MFRSKHRDKMSKWNSKGLKLIILDEVGLINPNCKKKKNVFAQFKNIVWTQPDTS